MIDVREESEWTALTRKEQNTWAKGIIERDIETFRPTRTLN